MNAPLPVFFTSFDPAELPGGTVDPLGFTAGYLALADQFFPEMTAAANQATYFPMLCAGLWIAESEGLVTESGARARKQRVDVALRFERLWALACGLAERQAAGDDDDAVPRTLGLRGIRYVERELERLEQAGARDTGTEFAVLAQQYRYGAFGIYASVAESLGVIDKTTLAPTPGLGDALGKSFLETTADSQTRKELKRAACDPKARIRLDTLATWGIKAYAGAPLSGETRWRLREAVLRNTRRREMLELVEAVFTDWTGEWWDQALLKACSERLEGQGDGASALATSLRAAISYDAFLREVLLVFERLLWLCRADNRDPSEVFADSVMITSAAALTQRARDLLAAADQLLAFGNTELSRRGRGVIELAGYFAAGPSVEDAVRRVCGRHADIQGSKLERGRPKQAWVVERDGRFALTSARFGLRTSEPVSAGDIHAPDWRFGAAISMLHTVGSFEEGADT